MSDILCVTNRLLCKDNYRTCQSCEEKDREAFLEQIRKIAAAHPAGIIFREKDLHEEEYKILAESVMKICKEYNTPCILHNYINAAIELKSQSIHLPLPVLRQMSAEEKAKFRTLGVSCHSVEDAIEAEKLGCTYITAGHVFDTDCKRGLPGRGIRFLKQVCESVSIPVFAIGGIKPENIKEVRAVGVAGACVMSGIMLCEDPEAYLTMLNTAQKQENLEDEYEV